MDRTNINNRRVDELEKQIAELRNREQERLTKLISSNKNRINDININSENEPYHNSYQAMLDAISVICYEL